MAHDAPELTEHAVKVQEFGASHMAQSAAGEKKSEQTRRPHPQTTSRIASNVFTNPRIMPR